MEVGCVLAFFQTTLAELLYPPTSNKCVSLGLDVDLLMEATDRFPVSNTKKIKSFQHPIFSYYRGLLLQN